MFLQLRTTRKGFKQYVEQLKAEGRLDEVEVPEEYSDELTEWTEDDRQEDDAETEELLSQVFYSTD